MYTKGTAETAKRTGRAVQPGEIMLEHVVRGERERMLHVVGLLESEEIETFSKQIYARFAQRVTCYIIIHL